MKIWQTLGCVLGMALGIFPGATVRAQETGNLPPDSQRAEFATGELYKTVAPMLISEPSPDSWRARVQEEAASDKGPDRILKLMYEGMDLVLDEDYEAAIPKLEEVLRAEPTMIPVWSTLGWTYWRVGRTDDAVRLWRRFLVLAPDHPMAHTLMGNAYVGTGRLREAEIHLRRSLELDPHQIEPQVVLGTLLRWTGRYQGSVKMLRELLDRHPDRLDVQNELGISLFESGRYVEAMPLLERGVRADPMNRLLARAHARCLLRTGNMTEAQLRARRLLHEDDADLELLLLLADAPRLHGEPQAAIPYLERIVDQAEDEGILTEAHLRLIDIRKELWAQEPLQHTLDEAQESARALLELDPDHSGWRQAYGELLLMNRQYMAAGEQFNTVLAYSTTNVLAARAGLFEVGQATTRYRFARNHLDYIASVNPSNPYLHQMEARLELSRANAGRAFRALDRLEAAGSRGAIAVLLYRVLSDSDWAETLSVRRFRLHMLALKQAGYTFLTPGQIPGYFAELERRSPVDVPDHRPDRAVIVTFDHADLRTLHLATDVARDLELVFALNVPVGLVAEGGADVVDEQALREFAETGHWVIGSQLLNASVAQPVRPDGRRGSLLANRLWIEADEMYESELEYARRLRVEYAQSRERLLEWLDRQQLVSFVAYPHGEYGQGLISNVDDAIAQNLHEAAINYEYGFIQTIFGYAVNGDNPLMYQRYAPGIYDTAEDLLDHLMMQHPVFMARRMRAEFAALSGKLYLARENLERLRRDHYPERPYARAETFVYDHLALKFGVARATAKASRNPFALDVRKPFAGGDFEWFKDSLDRRNWSTTWHGGTYLTPAVHAEVRTGYGRYRQQYTRNLADEDETPILETRRAEVSERFVGGRVGMRYQSRKARRSPASISAGLELHEFGMDADFDAWLYMLEMAFRPILYYDVLLRFEHDALPSARSLTEEVRYDHYAYAGALRLRDWWDLWSRVNYYDINDGNDRTHYELSSMWEVLPNSGLLGGAEFGYIHATQAKDDYWTPYHLNQWFLVAQLRNNIYRLYYDVALKFGKAREKIRREDQAAYDRLVERARRFRFDPGEAPESEWVDVFSASAALRMGLGRHWSAHWEGLYTESVDYHEYRTTAGLSLSF